MRQLSDPIVAAGPSGVRFRTRLHLSPTEAAALTEIGEHLGSVYRSELSERISRGVLTAEENKTWRAERKRAVTAVSSSRWAGAITRAVTDQYQLGMRSLASHVRDLKGSIDVLERRCALRPGEREPEDTDGENKYKKRYRGYTNAGERFSKTRRLSNRRQELATTEEQLAAGRPSITVGGKRLWRNRNNLAATTMDETQWRQRWDAKRMFLIADGETGRPHGNDTIRVDEQGLLRVAVPAALRQQYGTHLQFATPVRFSHGGPEVAARIAGNRAVRYDISFDPVKSRWYLDASWAITAHPQPEIEQLRDGRVIAVDLNADHLAACVLDAAGNPVGSAITIPLETKGARASLRDARLRDAVTAMLDLAEQHGCLTVVMENLNFEDARATGRETMGRGRKGKNFRRTVAGIPTAKFRGRVAGMSTRRGIAIIGVDPAYTSKWGDEHWRKPLQEQTSDTVTRHHGAAAAIGRRGLGKKIRRREVGPRTQQWMDTGTPPPSWPQRLPGTRGGKMNSSSPSRPRGTAVRRKAPPPVAKTVRATTEQCVLLLTD